LPAARGSRQQNAADSPLNKTENHDNQVIESKMHGEYSDDP
jgi:hypothetical protein